MINTTIISSKRKYVNSDTVIATVDIGSKTHWGYIRGGKKEIRTFSFSNSRTGFDKFNETIENFQAKTGLKKVILGFESTGSYGEPFINYFANKPVKLVQVNPMHTKRVKELGDNSPLKSDSKDPMVIANLIEMGCVLTVVIHDEVSAELRALTMARERASKSRTAKSNQITQLLAASFPEFFEVFKSVLLKSALYILRHHPLPKDVADCSIEQLTLEIKKSSKGQFDRKQALYLHKLAGKTIGVKNGNVNVGFEIMHLTREIIEVDNYIKELEKRMKKYLKDIDCTKSLLEINGLGEVTLAAIIGEIGDFNNFRYIREILKYGGLNLFEKSSGNHQGQRRISKLGSGILRKFLYFAALSLVRHDNRLRGYYRRKVSKGMLKNKALVVVAKKLLTIMFSMVHNHTRYDAFHGVHKEQIAA